MFQWLWKRVFSDRNVGFLMQKAEPYMSKFIVERVKEATFTLMEDEEFNAWLTHMGDAYYNRYMSKFQGWIGGKQKGINFAVDGAIDNANPLNAIMDDEGNFSLSKAIRTFMSGSFKGFGVGSPSPAMSTTPGERAPPLMKRLPP